MKLITIAEFVKETGLCRQTIAKQLKSGKLIGRKLGRQWFIDYDRVMEKDYGKEKEITS